jgi:hypothetical protein
MAAVVFVVVCFGALDRDALGDAEAEGVGK